MNENIGNSKNITRAVEIISGTGISSRFSQTGAFKGHLVRLAKKQTPCKRQQCKLLSKPWVQNDKTPGNPQHWFQCTLDKF